MFAKFFRISIFTLICTSAVAADTVSLREYLARANQGPISVIYSDALVRASYQVTFDPRKPITAEKLHTILNYFNLQFQVIGPDKYAVVAQAPIQPPENTTPQPQLSAWQEPSIEEVVVTSSRYTLFVQNSASQINLDHGALIERPALANDVLNQISQLPGTSTVGLSARPRVRGGNEDETLIQFDGMQLFDPFHLLNLFGSFDARTIDSIDFHSGGFSAEYGDRLSAVIEVNPQDLAQLDNQQEIGVGLFNVSYLYSGGSADQHYIVNARLSSLKLLTDLAESDLGEPSYADIYARYEWDKSEDTQFAINLFWFGDDLEINTPSGDESSQRELSNGYLWANLSQVLTDQLSVTSLIGTSAIRNNRVGEVNKDDLVSGMLDNSHSLDSLNLKQDYLLDWDFDRLLKFGWDYKFLKASYAFQSRINIDPAFRVLSNFERPSQQIFKQDLQGHQLAAYLIHKRIISDKLSFELGLRYDGQHYESSIHNNQISPRLGIHYKLNERATIRLSWGKFTQSEGLHELKVTDGLRTFQDPQSSRHLILGYDHRFEYGAKLRIEAYRKFGSKVNTYFENLTTPLSLLPELQPDRIQVSARNSDARGIELSYSQTYGSLDFWGNYSYATIRDQFATSSIKRTWDQAHTANLGLTIPAGGWRISMIGSFHTGWRTSRLTLQNNQAVVGERNQLKLKNYHSWAIKFTREWTLATQSFRLEMGFTNLFDHNNQIGTDYRIEQGQLVSEEKYGLPLVPFFDLYWKF